MDSLMAVEAEMKIPISERASDFGLDLSKQDTPFLFFLFALSFSLLPDFIASISARALLDLFENIKMRQRSRLFDG
jgi:hypothetical protein